jgi:hypothetical protein
MYTQCQYESVIQPTALFGSRPPRGAWPGRLKRNAPVGGGRFGAGDILRQGGFEEVVEVAVEDASGVAFFDPGAQVLDHLVGLEDVGADLVAQPQAALAPAPIMNSSSVWKPWWSSKGRRYSPTSDHAAARAS